MEITNFSPLSLIKEAVETKASHYSMDVLASSL